MSVFAGGATLEAVEAVGAGSGIERDDVLELLSALVGRYLVGADTDEDPTRYLLLETIRQYAADRLEERADTESVRTTHARYYAMLANELIQGSLGPDEKRFVQRLAAESDNLRLSLTYAISVEDTETALQMIDAITQRLVYNAGLAYRGLFVLADDVAALPGAADDPRYPSVLFAAGHGALFDRDIDETARRADLIDEAVARLGLPANSLPALQCALLRSSVAMSSDDLPGMFDAFGVLCSNPQPWVAAWLGFRAHLFMLVGDTETARADADKALVLARQLASPSVLANALSAGANVHARDDPGRALAYFREAVSLATQSEIALEPIATVAVRIAPMPEALAAWRRLFERARWSGYVTPSALESMAALFAETQPLVGAMFFGAVEARHGPGLPLAGGLRRRRDRAIAAVEAALGSEQRAELMAQGGSMSDARLAEVAIDAIDRALAEGHEIVIVVDDWSTMVDDAEPGADAAPPAAPVAASGTNEFRREGDTWAIDYDGTAVRLRDAKGLRYLARLLARPGQEIHVADLAVDTDEGNAIARSGDAGEFLDAEATEAYRRRFQDLDAERNDAIDANDLERAARAEAEMDTLTEQLTAAYGLGGRARTADNPTERVRKAVANRIKDSLRRISEQHPALGRHLTNAVRTGTYCSYRPERPTAWDLDPGA
jgi:tetratricopeptide (TPR) repeat protein